MVKMFIYRLKYMRVPPILAELQTFKVPYRVLLVRAATRCACCGPFFPFCLPSPSQLLLRPHPHTPPRRDILRNELEG